MPTPLNEKFPNFEQPTFLIDIKVVSQKDRVWALFQISDDALIFPLPTWAAFNSVNET